MALSVSGLSLLHPVALWGMTALAIPVLIHLFNRSRGRLVRIGHIDLIRQARKLKVTELKLAQWLLLLLRITLFVLAGLILAGLARPGLQNNAMDIAYVTPAWLATSSPAEKADLLKRYADPEASKIFVLSEAYPELELDSAKPFSALDIADVGSPNIWPMLTERLSIQHHQGDVEVYAVDLLQQFGSTRPALPRNVSWRLSHPPASDFVDQTQTTVTIGFDPEHKTDADVVRAALQSLKAYRLPNLSWETVQIDKLNAAQLQTDWLILLSDNGLSDEQFATITQPLTILSDANPDPAHDGNTDASQLEYLRLPDYPFTQFRAVLTENGDDKGLYNELSNSAGLAVIQTGQRGKARLVQFNSRFDQRWSTISAQATFPEFLLQLMQSKTQQLQSFADARVDISQLENAGEAISASTLPLPRHSLQQSLAVLMILLWLLERWLSERRRRD